MKIGGKANQLKFHFFLQKKLKINFIGLEPESDTEFIREADEALKLFLEKSEVDKLLISNLVHKDCFDFLNAVRFNKADQNLWDIKDKNQIWDFAHPTGILISRRPYQDQDIYLDINCECDWEQEHGLQLVSDKGKKLTRVSQIDGHLTDADA